MALEAVEQGASPDLATVHEKGKEEMSEESSPAPMQRRVTRDSSLRVPSRRGISRHSSGGVPGLRREHQLSRTRSMCVPRPLAHSKTETSEGSLSRGETLPLSPRRQVGGPRGMVGRTSSLRSGVSRSKSFADGPLTRGLKRNESAARGLPCRRHVGRTNSQSSLANMAVAENSVRPYRGNEQVVNKSNTNNGDRPTLRRSAEDRSYSDLSSFTLGTTEHSLAKKNQCADPIFDDQTYRETDSMADHESCVSGDIPNYTEFLPEVNPNHVPYDGASVAGTLCTFDSVQLRRKQMVATNSNHSFDASSFSTFASGDMNMDGEFEEYLEETGYYDDFYLDETHVVQEEEAEHSDDEETIEGEVSDNDDVDVDDDDSDKED
jgi:hypothetical protein